MTETGLIIAEVAFLVLLYLFVWAIIRASSRQLRAEPPQAPPPPDGAPLIVPLTAEAQPEEALAPDAAFPVYEEPSYEDRAELGLEPEPAGQPAGPSPTALGGAAIAAGGAALAANDGPEEDVPADEILVDLPPDDGTPAEEGLPDDATVSEPGNERDPLLGLASNIHPRLVVQESAGLDPGQEFDLTGGITIGRSESSGLAVSDQFVSHMHARILRRGPYYFIEDLGSTNGTFINDRRVERDAQLRVRDVVRMGDTVLRYEE